MTHFRSWTRLRWIRQGCALLLGAALALLGLLGLHADPQPLTTTPRYTLDSYCRQSPSEINRKAQVRAQAGQSNGAWATYTQVIGEHREMLQRCRQVRWPQTQAIWLRLYPCDNQPGILDDVFDRIVNLGYNRVFIEVFRETGTVLPSAASGPWSTTTQDDLLRLALNAARRRGLSAYAWMFSLNFGYGYQRADRPTVLAYNGRGQTTLQDDNPDLSQIEIGDIITTSEVFIDPVSPQARQDYSRLLQQVLQRRPDGVLFDYIRYPRGAGRSTISQQVKDLWIYGEASQRAFIQLGVNPPGQELLRRFLQRGSVTAGDIQAVDAAFNSVQPQWRPPGRGQLSSTPVPTPDLSPELNGLVSSGIQGELQRPVPKTSPTPKPAIPSVAARRAQWQPQLWQLAVQFARYGVVDFLQTMSKPVQEQGIPSGAVFFPDANRAIQGGFDARLQPWDQFTSQNEWHPMAYALCEDASCVVREVDKVLKAAPPSMFVCPAIAGLWGIPLRKRPPLEIQMGQLQQQFPQLPCISHFSYSWIEGQSTRDRQACRVSAAVPSAP